MKSLGPLTTGSPRAGIGIAMGSTVGVGVATGTGVIIGTGVASGTAVSVGVGIGIGVDGAPADARACVRKTIVEIIGTRKRKRIGVSVDK